MPDKPVADRRRQGLGITRLGLVHNVASVVEQGFVLRLVGLVFVVSMLPHDRLFQCEVRGDPGEDFAQEFPDALPSGPRGDLAGEGVDQRHELAMLRHPMKGIGVANGKGSLRARR